MSLNGGATTANGSGSSAEVASVGSAVPTTVISSASILSTTNTALKSMRPNPYLAAAGSSASASSMLHHRNLECKPVPPPTLPKYTSSFNAGQQAVLHGSNNGSSTGTGSSLRDRENNGTGSGSGSVSSSVTTTSTTPAVSSFRMSALDRLAMRQKFIEQSGGSASGSSSIGSNHYSGTGATSGATATTAPTTTSFTNGVTNAASLAATSTASSSIATNGVLNAASSASSSDATAATVTTAASRASQFKKEFLHSSNSNGAATAATAAASGSSFSVHKKIDSNGKDETAAPKLAPKPDLIPTPKTKTIRLDGYVGFANLPNQVHRKALKRGFEFTLMVVGESGLGKSTLINSMFLTDIYSQEYPGPTLRTKKTVAVETTKVALKEHSVNLNLTIVDTPGFGDAVDNSNCWAPILDHIDTKYEEYLDSESRVNRRTPHVPDQRVHCCLYFIQATGHGLKPLDIEFMKRLCDKVNIVPVIAKADTLTPEECQLFKRQIMTEIGQHNIKIYEFPDMTDDEDEQKLNKKFKDRVPFAVVGSNTIIELEGGKKVRGRKYPWGVVQVESLEHCDFLALRNMIIQIHLQDLKDVTNNVHYENYRCRKLAGLGFENKSESWFGKNLLAQLDEEKREHDHQMREMEKQMEIVFEEKVKEKIQKVTNSEAELKKRHEATKRALDEQARELELRRKQFEMEKQQWERDNSITIEELQRRSLLDSGSSKETLDGSAGAAKKDKKKKSLF